MKLKYINYWLEVAQRKYKKVCELDTYSKIDMQKKLIDCIFTLLGKKTTTERTSPFWREDINWARNRTLKSCKEIIQSINI